MFIISPGVYPREIPLSTIISSVATSIGAIVGPSDRGPLEPKTMKNTKKFTDTYGKTITSNYFHYTGLSFLDKGTRLICLRVTNGALFGGVEVTNIGSLTPVAPIDQPGGCPNPPSTNYTWDSPDAVFALFGANPGVWNNNLGIEISYNPTKLARKANFTFGSDQVTGDTGSRFLSEIAVGDLVFPSGQEIFSATVKSIESDSSLTLTSTWAGAGAILQFSYINTLEFYISLYEKSGTSISFIDKYLCSRVPTARDGFGNSIYIEDVFDNHPYILALDRTSINPTNPANMPKEVSTTVYFGNGSNGNPVTAGDIIGGIEKISNPDKYTLNILMSGGWMSDGTSMFSDSDIESIHVYADNMTQNRKDCFAILDSPFDKDVDEVIDWRTNELTINSSYSGLFTPWVESYDQYNDKRVFIPPSGLMGAVFAYTDYISDPWIAPAGLNRGILPVLDVKDYYDRGDLDALYEAQINPIRKYHVGGVVVWGQKTLQTKPSATDRINVRRLLIVIEKAIATTLDYFVFEPNTHFKRLQITSLIEGYMNEIVARFGVYDFRVVCDETNNTGDIIDRNEMNVDLYVKPVRAAEFIKLNVVIVRTSVSFDEVLLPYAS